MKFLLLTAVVLSSVVASAQSAKRIPNAIKKEITLPFAIISDFGHRPAIVALVNGFPIKFEVHSNAGFFMQISHEAANKASITNKTHVDSFGIQSIDKVSSLGRDSALVNQLTIKNVTYKNAPASIFETPSPFNVGMLGLRWLTKNSVAIDYAKQRIVLNSAPKTAIRRRQKLLQEGYIAVPMVRDMTDGRYLIDVNVNGITRPMIVSTVSANTFDITFAQAAGIPYIDRGKNSGGPSGTTQSYYNVKNAVIVNISNYNFAVSGAGVEDTYGYMAKKRPDDILKSRGGMLAADFMIAYKAVVDFGHSILFLKKP